MTDRPETMTPDDVWSVERWANLIGNDDSTAFYRRILATHAALEAVKAENAELQQHKNRFDVDWRALCDENAVLRAQLAEAQAAVRWCAERGITFDAAHPTTGGTDNG